MAEAKKVVKKLDLNKANSLKDLKKKTFDKKVGGKIKNTGPGSVSATVEGCCPAAA